MATGKRKRRLRGSRKNKDLRLEPVSPELSAVDSNTPDDTCCGVIVTRSNGRPARGIQVRFRIVKGPLRFKEVRAKTVTLETDRSGHCAPTVIFTERGKAVVTAELEGNDSQALAFQPYTEGMTHRLFVYAPSSVKSARGKIEISVSAFDHHGEPVKNALLSISAAKDGHSLSAGVRRRGATYKGAVKTKSAGNWLLSAVDSVTGAQASEWVQVVADKPHRIRIVGDPDPRLKRPYNQALVRAVVLDRFGNQLDPRNITCKLDSKAVKRHALVGDEAHFLFDATGAKTLDVNLRVKRTRVSKRRKILSAAAWLGDPGLVIVGKRYRSPLYLTPEPGRRVTEATIKVDYNAKQVKFLGFRPNRELPLETTVEHKPGKLKVSITSPRPIGYRKYPEGIPIGYIDWQCQGKGKTCVSVVASMSPPTPPWEKCTSQKEDLVENVCVNFIYNQNDGRLTSLPSQVRRIRQRLNDIYNDDDTIKTCCPITNFAIHTTGMSRADWLNKVLIPSGIADTGGSGTIRDGDITANTIADHFGRRDNTTNLGTTEGIQAGCVNFYLVDFDMNSGTIARTKISPAKMDPGDPTSGDAGFGVIDPDRLYTDTTPHEIGHALGLRHDPPGPDATRDQDELMWGRASRTDTKINRRRDCRKIWENVGTY